MVSSLHGSYVPYLYDFTSIYNHFWFYLRKEYIQVFRGPKIGTRTVWHTTEKGTGVRPTVSDVVNEDLDQGTSVGSDP